MSGVGSVGTQSICFKELAPGITQCLHSTGNNIYPICLEKGRSLQYFTLGCVLYKKIIERQLWVRFVVVAPNQYVSSGWPQVSLNLCTPRSTRYAQKVSCCAKSRRSIYYFILSCLLYSRFSNGGACCRRRFRKQPSRISKQCSTAQSRATVFHAWTTHRSVTKSYHWKVLYVPG